MGSLLVTDTFAPLPPLAEQADRLVALGIPGMPAAAILEEAARVGPADGGLLVVHPSLIPPSRLAANLVREGMPGFVVEDMTDVDEFAPADGVVVPESAVYVVRGLDRGDEFVDRTPDESVPVIVGRGRTPLTLAEGIHWVLQQPEVLERNRCFMTAGSRLVRQNGTRDARVPAVWISNGTGRDGRDRRDAAKVGWCWAGNRHTWLGIASASGRRD